MLPKILVHKLLPHATTTGSLVLSQLLNTKNISNEIEFFARFLRAYRLWPPGLRHMTVESALFGCRCSLCLRIKTQRALSNVIACTQSYCC